MQNQNELLHTLTVEVLPTLTPEAAGLLVLREMGRHPDRVCPHFDLIFFRSGTLDMQEEGRQFRVQAGQALLLWPNRGHGRTAAYPAGLSFYWIHFRMEPTEGARDASEVLPVPPWATPARPDHLTALFRRYLDDQEEGALDSVSAGLIILLMLREMSRPPLPGAGVERSSVIPARRAQAYIQDALPREDQRRRSRVRAPQ